MWCVVNQDAFVNNLSIYIDIWMLIFLNILFCWQRMWKILPQNVEQRQHIHLTSMPWRKIDTPHGESASHFENRWDRILWQYDLPVESVYFTNIHPRTIAHKYTFEEMWGRLAVCSTANLKILTLKQCSNTSIYYISGLENFFIPVIYVWKNSNYEYILIIFFTVIFLLKTN